MPVKYDKRVKRPNAEHEYTKQEIIDLKRCQKDFFYFAKYVKIIHPDKGEIPYEPFDFQKDILDLIINNRFFITLCSRQSGKSTTIAIYTLWYAMFNKDKVIGIASNKEKNAKGLLFRLKKMWESLPNWLKPGVKEWGKTEIILGNDSRISISTTTGSAGRSESINCVSGDSVITLKDKETDKVFDITMAELETILNYTEGSMDFQLIDIER